MRALTGTGGHLGFISSRGAGGGGGNRPPPSGFDTHPQAGLGTFETRMADRNAKGSTILRENRGL